MDSSLLEIPGGPLQQIREQKLPAQDTTTYTGSGIREGASISRFPPGTSRGAWDISQVIGTDYSREGLPSEPDPPMSLSPRLRRTKAAATGNLDRLY